jgi:hypothetical protein
MNGQKLDLIVFMSRKSMYSSRFTMNYTNTIQIVIMQSFYLNSQIALLDKFLLYMYMVTDQNTVKPAHAVTFIKQSSV